MPVNGALDFDLLAPIGGGRQLELGAAIGWSRLLSAVRARYGWTPALSPGATAYRSKAQQVLLFELYYTTLFSVGDKDQSHAKYWDGKTWWRRPGRPAAATPGTSNHGWGKAVDIAGLGGFTGTRYKQLAAVAPTVGWNNREGQSIDEAWHWVYAGPPAPNIPEDDMPLTVADADLVVGRLLNYNNGQAKSLYGLIIDAARSTPDPLTVAEITAGVWATEIRRGSTTIPVLQEIANIRTAQLNTQPGVGGDVDEAALAAAVSAAVVAEIKRQWAK